LRDDLEVDRRKDEVREEQQQEGDDHGLVHRVTDALGATPRVQTLVRRDQRGDEAEHQCLELPGVQVGQLGQCRERREVRTRRTALDHDVEEVTAADTDHADEAVE
jgi:hypothetical protein